MSDLADITARARTIGGDDKLNADAKREQLQPLLSEVGASAVADLGTRHADAVVRSEIEKTAGGVSLKTALTAGLTQPAGKPAEAAS